MAPLPSQFSTSEKCRPSAASSCHSTATGPATGRSSHEQFGTFGGRYSRAAMDVTVSTTDFEGVLVLRPDAFEDNRGFFMESYHQQKLRKRGVDLTFIQDNHSRSHQGVLRGFHYQDSSAPQTRLVRCTVGEIFDVIVDLQIGSPTFGKYFGIRLSAENRQQLLIPPQFAHGFVVLSSVAEVQYKCTGPPRAGRGTQPGVERSRHCRGLARRRAIPVGSRPGGAVVQRLSEAACVRPRRRRGAVTQQLGDVTL